MTRVRKILLSGVISVIIVVGLTVSAFASQWSPGSGTSTIALLNVDPAQQPATYVVELKGQDGTTDATITGQPAINFRGGARLDVGTLGSALGSGWKGSAVVSSDRLLIAAVNHRYQNPAYSSGDGWNGGAYTAPEPATKVYMPYLTQVDPNPYNAGRFSWLTVQNAGSAAATVYVRMYAEDGAFRGLLTQNLQPGRSWTWEPAMGENRSAIITSTQPVVASFDGFWSLGLTSNATAWSTSYESIAENRVSTRLIFPNVYRVRVNTNESGAWVQWSNVLVQNTSVVSTANVTVTFYRTGVSVPVWEFNDTIPPNSSHQYNTQYGGTGGYPSSTDFRNNLGAGFYGSVIVVSDQPLVGVSHSFWDTYFRAGSTYSALAGDQGAYAVYTPFVNKVGTCGQDSSWSAWTKVAVANVDTVPANIYVYFLDNSGNMLTAPALQGIPIAEGGADGINTRFGSDSGVVSCSTIQNIIGTSFQGSMLITSTAKIVGINNMIWTNRINTINTQAAP